VWAYIYDSKYAKNNYAGADEPGYYYPDKVREDFIIGCKKGFVKELKKSKTSIPEDDLERLCECFLGEFEDRFSYEEFENKYAKSTAQSNVHIPDEIKDAIETCVKQQGY